MAARQVQTKVLAMPTYRDLPAVGLLTLSLALGLPIAGCAGDSEGELLGVDCGGKCDGFDDIRALIRDPSELDLDDLIRIGAPYATEEINDLLEVSDYASLQISETAVFDEGALDQLSTGLAARFGERELSTAVNQLRRQHLASSGDTVFGESSFAMRGDLSFDFALDTGDDQGNLRLGFGGGELTVHMVAAYDDDIDAILDAPLATAKQARNFVLPRSADDILEMKPGESIGLHGGGSLGINIAVGVPIVIANPVGPLAYKFVITGGLRSVLEGELDIQLVRMDGDEVVVDVGMERARIKSKRVGLTDGWGLQGLLELEVEVGPASVDLGRLVERALEKQLNRRLELVNARAESSSHEFRMSVSRLRFDLGAGDRDLVDAALAQALRGDVRLAQALANRGEPGVVAEFDLARAGVSSTSYAGIEIVGMNFFRQQIEAEGSAVVQTPGGARAILWESLHRSSGWFLARHGFSRVALSSVGFDGEGGALPTGEANLIVQIDEGDKAMERDKFVDHIDSVIVSVAGIGALAALEASGNQIEDLVETECAGTQVFDDCPIDMLTDSRAVALRQQAQADFERELSGLSAEVAQLMRRAGELRLMAQSVYEQKASFTGPGVSITAGYRLDDGSLAALLDTGAGARVGQAMANIIGATEIDRRGDAAGQRAAVIAEAGGDLDRIEALVDDYAARYRLLRNIEAAAIERLGGIGAKAIEIRFEVDAQDRANYESAAANTIAARRAAVAAELFDAVRDEAGGLGPHAEQAAGYALLGAAPRDRADLRLDLDLNTDDTFAFWREPYRAAGYPTVVDQYARGPATQRIDGGQFSVDQLIRVE
jgi:hypothetical protein